MRNKYPLSTHVFFMLMRTRSLPAFNSASVVLFLVYISFIVEVGGDGVIGVGEISYTCALPPILKPLTGIS